MVAESFPKLLTTILLGFNRAIGELGVALMLGGNIKGFTRVMTTVIALEVSKGEFEFALTLAGILLLVTFAVTAIVRKVSKTA
jgi:tungstate transport system permease protein